MENRKNKIVLLSLLTVYVLTLIWSLIHPFDLLLWFYESTPAIVGVVILVLTYSKFEFTRTTYVWCFIAAWLMTIGVLVNLSFSKRFLHYGSRLVC